MKVFYRFNDRDNNKVKEPYVTKLGTLTHFLHVFQGYTIFIVADNIQDSTYEYLKTLISEKNILRTNLGAHKAFLFSIYYALSNFNETDKIYFAEDDYIYTRDAPRILEDGLDISDYVSGYDHPDKYVNYKEGGDNPFIEEGGEATRVIISKSRHWKLTNSCCHTFGTKMSLLKLDLDVFKKYADDFPTWRELITCRNRKLISCIPAVSTHCETKYLSPFIDWKKEYTLNR